MKMAALQLMQQKANREANKASPTPDVPALPATDAAADSSSETSTETLTESNADEPQAQDAQSSDTTQASTDTPEVDQSDSSATATSVNAEDSSKPAVNGPSVPAAAILNGESESPLAGKEAEESIPGLAQAKELAESLVAQDGYGIGMSNPFRRGGKPRQTRTKQG